MIIFTVPVQAQEKMNAWDEYYDLSELNEVVESLDEDTKSILSRWGLSVDSVISGNGVDIKAMGQVVLEWMINGIRAPLASLTACFGVILLCALVRGFMPNPLTSMHGISEYFSPLCTGLVLVTPIADLIVKTASAIGSVGGFMIAFVPVFVAVLLAAGRTATANGAATGLYACSQGMVYLADHGLLPFVGSYIALTVSQSVGGVSIGGLIGALKRTLIWLLGGATALFSGVLCLTGVINAAGDSMGQRATRFVVGNMVPIIGGSLSEALATFRGCFRLLQTGSGMLGISVVAALLLPVGIELLLWRITLALTASLAELFQLTTAYGLIKGVADGVELLFAVAVCCFLVYIVSLSVLSVVGGASI